MEAIKCPNCGSEKVQALSEEKYVCLACDNVFLVHNLSKEFRQTDAHLEDVHADLKRSIEGLKAIGEVDEQKMLQDAEEHLAKKNYQTAFDLFIELSEKFPAHSAGWYGAYRAMTKDFTFVENCPEFLCGGGEEDGAALNFHGYNFVRNALDCEDANKEEITSKVIGFLKSCAESEKLEAEKSIVAGVETRRINVRNKNAVVGKALAGGLLGVIKAMIPAVLVLMVGWFLLGLMLVDRDFIMRVIYAGLLFLVVKFGWRIVLRSVASAFSAGRECKSNISELLTAGDEALRSVGYGIYAFCIDLDNYNLILKDISDGTFMSKYLSEDYEGLTGDDEIDYKNQKGFIPKLLSGGYERYNYLIGDTNARRGMELSADGIKVGCNKLMARFNDEMQHLK